MQCKFCGKKIPDKSKFCPHCGERIFNLEEENKVSFDEAYNDFLSSSEDLKEKRINKYNEESMQELDAKVRDFLDKRKKQKMTKEDFALEDISDVKYMRCDSCGENVVRGMAYCPKCGEKLPYVDHSYEKRYKGLVTRFALTIIVLCFAGFFIYNNFIKKPSTGSSIELPNSLPGGETIGSDYEYMGDGAIFFPAGDDLDDADDIEDEEIEEETEGEDFVAQEIGIYEGEDDYEIREGDIRGPH